MLLSCRFLNAVKDVNTFEYTDAVEYYQGDQQTLFFQLVDESLDRTSEGFNPSGRRYMPAAPATMFVTFRNINNVKVVYRAGVQAFPTSDPSIWSVPILSSDPLNGTISVSVQLFEPNGVVHSFTNGKGFVLRVR
jgi:hypothetical protein